MPTPPECRASAGRPAALDWATNPKLDAAGVAATLEGTAASQGAWTRDLAFGAINIAAAVQRAAGNATDGLAARDHLDAEARKARPRAVTKKTKRARP